MSISAAGDTEFHDWLGRSLTAEDIVGERLIREFEATFSPHLADRQPEIAPLLLHWCLAPEAVPLAGLGEDGHPAKGGFLPPIPLPRRMWVGSDVVFHDALRVGDRVRRQSTIAGIRRKQGRTGSLYFVEIDHDVSTDRGTAVAERQTIVYRPETSTAAPPREPVLGEDAEVARIDMPEVRLFRYSSLTFNGHRIHYDYPYATGREGYAGLVVHGPLQATLLANAAARLAGGALSTFGFRAVSPLIAGGRASLRAARDRESIECCLCDGDGGMTMQAEATFRRQGGF